MVAETTSGKELTWPHPALCRVRVLAHPDLSFLSGRGPADLKACVPRGVMVGKARRRITYGQLIAETSEEEQKKIIAKYRGVSKKKGNKGNSKRGGPVSPPLWA